MNSGGSLWDFLIGLAVYLGLGVAICVLAVLPGIIAFKRHAQNRWFILAVNLVFGETGIGWIVALVWACRARSTDDSGRAGRTSGAGLDLMMDDIRRLPVFTQAIGEPPEASRGPAPAGAGIVDAIERLSVLAAQGYLAPDEFAALKARLLAYG